MKTKKLVWTGLVCAVAITAVVGCAQLSATTSKHGVIPAKAGDQMLLAFDNETIPTTVTGNNAKLQLVPNPGAVGGKYAVEASLSAVSDFSGIVFQPAQPWDWSKEGEVSLAFDIANVGETSVHLYVDIVDQSGASQVRAVNVPLSAKPTTYYLVLNGEEKSIKSGLRDNPPGFASNGQKLIWLWGADKVDLSKIAKVSLYTDTVLRDHKIVISSVRLLQNPKFDPNFLVGVCDQFGQNAKVDFPTKVHSDAELKALAKAEMAALAKSKPLADRSKWGGWKNGPRLKATGYFRTEKVGGKWALVDPEGCLYFSTGIANARMANTATVTGVDFHAPTVRQIDPEDVTPEDSKGFLQTTPEARKTRYIASELRHNMFEWLPEYGSELDGHYSYERTVHQGAIPHGESFSFYEANLERRYGEATPSSYMTTWRDVTVQRMLDWGFTSMANWTDVSFFQADKIPYFANGWIIGNFKTVKSGFDYWSPLPDPFDPEFKRRAKATVSAIAAEVKGSPWCVGVFVDNEKGWGKEGSFESRFGLVINALTYDAAQSPTKAAFTRLMQDKYQTIEALNQVWGTSVESWDAFGKSVSTSNRSAAVEADFHVMAQAFCDEYFRTVRDELRAVLPHHLYMGVRMAHWGLTPETRESAKKYSDVVSYNFYKEGIRAADWKFLKEVDMPSIIGEFHMGAISDTGLFHPGLIMAADQSDRGRMFKEYMESVIDNPYFVGAHWFQYIDSPLTGRSYDGENYNVGFVTIADIPYPEMVKAAKELNGELYERRFGNLKANP